MDIDNSNITPQKPPLRYHETLDAFADVIDEYYYECEIDVYRTCVTNPPTEFDITPKRRRFTGTQGPEVPFVYSEEELALMDKESKKEEVDHDAISVHKSEGKEIKQAQRSAVSFSEKHSVEETREYIYNQRGVYVMKLHITPDKALVSKSFHKSTGHGNILLREGVTIEDLLAEGYEIKEFKYDDDDK